MNHPLFDFHSFDWAATPLGPRPQWSASLKAIFSMMLGSPMAMCLIWGPEQTFLYNAAYAPFLGKRHPAALGTPINEVWAEIWDDIGPLVRRVLSGESVSFTDMHLVMKRNGYDEDTWWSFSYCPVHDDDRIVGFLNIATDATAAVIAARQRDAAEAETHARNLELESQIAARNEAVERARIDAERVQLALAAGAIVGTWVWNIKLDQFTIDEGFAKAFGLNPTLGHQQITLERVVETVHPDDKAGLSVAIETAVKRGGPYMHQYRVKRHDGLYYWIEANGRVEFDANGVPDRFPGVLIDRTVRRDVEAERDRVTAELRELNSNLEQRVTERTVALLETEEALRQSQKMEAVGQLTGGLAHDFNNLLAGISGALELMQFRTLNGQFRDFERYLLTAQNGVKRAASLTHRLLAFSRRQTLDPRPADVNRLVAGMQELIQRTVGPSNKIEVVAAGGLWPALVDSSQLENSLLNLCINARDAMPHGGRITIETANIWLDEREARQHDMAAGQYLSLRVIDTGIGMSPEVIDKVFEPFFTTKPLGEGTGLGLSMVYGFAKQSNGQVRIYSEVGMGTTICIYLPRHLGNIEEDILSQDVRAVAPSDKINCTVLIVDDDPMLRMLVVEMLSEFGYNALEASDSAAGLKILQSDVAIDLLISDVGLPGGLNGKQMADAALQIRPSLKVLFITGYADHSVMKTEHLHPRMQVMTKPFEMQAFAARIRSMLANHH